MPKHFNLFSYRSTFFVCVCFFNHKCNAILCSLPHEHIMRKIFLCSSTYYLLIFICLISDFLAWLNRLMNTIYINQIMDLSLLTKKQCFYLRVLINFEGNNGSYTGKFLFQVWRISVMFLFFQVHVDLNWATLWSPQSARYGRDIAPALPPLWLSSRLFVL